jgi:hypothetical protein
MASGSESGQRMKVDRARWQVRDGARWEALDGERWGTVAMVAAA